MNILETINELGKKAKDASIKIRVLQKEKKMMAYQYLEKNIKKNADQILSSNKLDIENAIVNDLSKQDVKTPVKVVDDEKNDSERYIGSVASDPAVLALLYSNDKEFNKKKRSKKKQKPTPKLAD